MEKKVPGLKNIYFGNCVTASFIEAHEVYFTSDTGSKLHAMCYIEDEEAAKVYISQCIEGDRPYIKYRKVVLLNVGDENILLDNFSVVIVENSDMIKHQLLNGIYEKLLPEEADFISSVIRKSKN